MITTRYVLIIYFRVSADCTKLHILHVLTVPLRRINIYIYIVWRKHYNKQIVGVLVPSPLLNRIHISAVGYLCIKRGDKHLAG